jgi:DNA-binding Lrp family transcriptional regulator
MVKNISLSHNFYLDIVSLLLGGLNPSKIARQLGISPQRVNYYIRRLKRENLIKKTGYGVWETKAEELKKMTKKAPISFISPDSVRGHNFIFKIRIKNLKNWDKREQIIKQLGIPYEMKGILRKTPRIIFKGHKVWLCKDSLLIFYPKGKSYFTDTASESYKYAIYDLQHLIIGLEGLLGADFRINGNYVFTPSKSHYSLVKNSLACQYNKEKKKLNVYDSDGLWLIIDNSLQLHELEIQGKGLKPLSNNEKIQNFFNDLKINYATMGEMKELMQGFSHNLVTHFQVLKGIEEAIKELKDAIRGKE